MRLLPLIFFLLGCGKAHAREDLLAPTTDISLKYKEVVARIDRDFTPDGWIVTKFDDGRLDHLGDSLIWTGLWLAAAPCDIGVKSENALLKMLKDMDGRFYRHPTLSDKWSTDGAIGLYRGISSRLKRCPGTAEKWRTLFSRHLANGQKIEPEVDYVRDYLGYRLGIINEPEINRRIALGKEMEVWALAVRSIKAACFRINLSYLIFTALDDMRVFAESHDSFCRVTDGLTLATVNHWCGRGDVNDFVNGFKYDRFEYRHQLCQWQDEPVYSDRHTPGLDLAILLKDSFILDDGVAKP